MESTLVLIKPDGVKKRCIGEIISRFEKRGLQIVALKILALSESQANRHYAEHSEKPFFSDLVTFITSGSVVAILIKGKNAIKVVRAMMGATNPADAVPGTIRGDYALEIENNVIHGSDSPESAAREIANIFSGDKISY